MRIEKRAKTIIHAPGVEGNHMKELQFSQFVLGKDYPPFALITLNQDIDTPLYEKLTQRASFRVCADGGFDRLIQYCNANNIKLDTMLPNLLVGDLDSISPAALESARKAGVMVEKVHCQDTTDFQKSIKAVERHASADFKQHMRIIVVGAIDGRFDHTVASISVLYEYPKIEIWLLSKVSLIALLDAVIKPPLS
jgi:thiamine pyrophosphokinase